MTVRYQLHLTAGDDRELVAARLWVAGAHGVQELPDGLVAWFDDRTDAVPPGGSWADEPDRDWLAGWREGLGAVVVGGIHVVPSWTTHEPAPDAVVLRLDPGVAFGTGHHATTALCLAALQRHLAPTHRVVDVGTGTGILAIAAALLGAREVVAVDVDVQAVDACRVNAAANGCDVDVRLGGPDAVRAPGDLVLANLLTPTLHALADELAALTAPGGVLVASGVASERADGVAARLAAAGLEPVDRADRDGWAALELRHPT